MSSTPTTSEATETGGGQPATEAWGDAETDAVDGLEMLDDALFVERDEELRLPTHTNAEEFRSSFERARDGKRARGQNGHSGRPRRRP